MLNKNIKLAIWICNLAIAVLGVLSIAFYFFLPYWKLNISYTIEPKMLNDMVGDSVEFDPKEIVGEKGVTLELSLEFDMDILLKAYGDEDAAVEALLDDNVGLIIDKLTVTLNTIAKRALRSITSGLVSGEVWDSVKSILADITPGITDDDVTQRLNDIGITDDFISSKTNAIIDKIFDDGSTVDDVCDDIVNTVDEIYSKIATSDDTDLQGAELSEEDKENIRKTVKDAMETMAAEDGTLNADELIASIFLYAIGANGNSADDGSNYDEKSRLNGERSLVVAPLNESEETTQPATERLKAEVRKFILDKIPAEISSVIGLVMRILTVLFFFSSVWWIYVIIKILVKFLRRNEPKVEKNPTVKLGTVIWLGWLPFLILVGLPSLALWVLTTFLADTLPPEMISPITSSGISFASSGIMAAIGALVAFGISIFFMVIRKKVKNAEKLAATTPQGEAIVNRSAAPQAENISKVSADMPQAGNIYGGGAAMPQNEVASTSQDSNAYGDDYFDNFL